MIMHLFKALRVDCSVDVWLSCIFYYEEFSVTEILNFLFLHVWAFVLYICLRFKNIYFKIYNIERRQVKKNKYSDE